MSANPCEEQSCLLQEDILDEAGKANTRNTATNSRKIETDAGAAPHGPRTSHNGVLGNDDKYEDLLPPVDLDDQPGASPQDPPRAFFQRSPFILSLPTDDGVHIPHYRILPILSGVTVPLCILLDIPGLLTADWSLRVDRFAVVPSKPNPPLLNVGITLSTLCAVLANACLIVRFLERRVKGMTILCILFLSTHDIINIATLTTFGVMRNDQTYSQAFWMTLCSIIVSMFTNVTLIIDFIRTPNFTRSGSGLTRKQRSLVIIIIGLLFYIVLGALVSSLLLKLTFINGLYFTIVTITTIGLGDIVPKSPGSRVFICVYATMGLINFAFMVGYVRAALLEGLDFGFRRRLLAIQERRRTGRLRRRAEKRWRHAVMWRLREGQAPLWVPKKTKDSKSVWSILTGIRWTTGKGTQSHDQHGMQLNVWGLSPYQLEAAALEAGVPLHTLLPPDFYSTYDQHSYRALSSGFAVHATYPQREHPPTHRWIGSMAVILTKLSFAIYESGGNHSPNGHVVQNAGTGCLVSSETKDGDYRADVEDTEEKAYYARSILSCFGLLIFWMGGAALFRATEGWNYGLAVYFCFISFSSIGYGDLGPATQAGRSIYVVWALIGVIVITIFVSVISEAYTTRYNNILARSSFRQVIRRCHGREKVEPSEPVECTRTSAEIKCALPNTSERAGTNEKKDEFLPASDGITLAATLISQPDEQGQHTKWSPTSLSHQILTEARSIRQYMQLVSDSDGHSAEGWKFVAEAIWDLIDDIMDGTKLTDESKKDILKDTESLQMLMLLGIERSVKALESISEQATAGARERDRIMKESRSGRRSLSQD